MRKIVLSIFAVLAVSFAAVAQNQRVSGTVADASGAPIPGATVIVVGTTTGASTNADGSYSIQVPANGSLEFRFMGKVTQTLAVDRRTVINVVMQDDKAIGIGDVLVVAFGEANKTTFMGSATQLDNEELSKRTSANVVNTLAGQIAGVQIKSADGQPGSEAQIRIRGVMTINSSVSTSPLIILDGMEYSGNLSTINTNDIETFTVLKDAASAALYGSRGANGVILINTRKGKSGEAKITVDMKWGVGARAQKDYDVITDPAQHYETAYAGFYNYYYRQMGYSNADANVQANRDMVRSLGYVVYETNGNPLIGLDGKLYSGATEGKVYTGIDGNQYLIKPDNWIKEAFSTSLRKEYNVSIVGGTDRSSFYGSIGYLDDQGIVASSYLKRFTARLNSEYKAKSWLTVGGNFNFSNIDTSSPGSYTDGSASSGNIFAFTSQMAPIYPVYVRDPISGNVMTNSHGKIYDYGDGVYLGEKTQLGIVDLDNPLITRSLLANANPLQQNVLDKEGEVMHQFDVVGYAIARINKNFKFTVQGATSIREDRYFSYVNPYYGQYSSEKGEIQVYNSRTQNLNMTQMLDYSQSFGKHNVTAMIGHDFASTSASSLYATRSHMFSQDIFELSNAVVMINSGSTASDYMAEGYIGRATYDYDQKYFGSFSFRRDASSNFDPRYRWGNFWSASGGWIISSEEFMRDLTWVDLLKFKASYGERGNDGIPSYSYIDTYSIEKASDDGDIALVFQRHGTPDITWETIADFNTGLDFGLFGNKLTGTIEYYQRNSRNLLFLLPAPPSGGYPNYYANAGHIRNNGFELDLHGVVWQGKDYSLTLYGNITTNRSIVLSIPDEIKDKSNFLSAEDGTNDVYLNGFANGLRWVGEGDAMYTYYLQRYAGVNEYGQSQWYHKVWNDASDHSKGYHDEVTTTYGSNDEYRYLLKGKSGQPDAFGGFGFTFEYKGFDLSVNFDYQIGGYLYDGPYASLMGNITNTSFGTAIHKDVLNAWSPNNTSSNIPRWQVNVLTTDNYANAQSDRWLVSSSYLSWGNVNLGYTFPSKWTKSISIEKLRIYASLENINYWTARRGMDPRGSFNGAASSFANYSAIRTISGGLQVTF